jgi:hypothetical protein
MLPTICVYGFSTADDPVEDFRQHASRVLGYDVQGQGHLVRDVAPKKMMVCLTFRLPEAVAREQRSEPVHESRAAITEEGGCNESKEELQPAKRSKLS